MAVEVAEMVGVTVPHTVDRVRDYIAERIMSDEPGNSMWPGIDTADLKSTSLTGRGRIDFTIDDTTYVITIEEAHPTAAVVGGDL